MFICYQLWWMKMYNDAVMQYKKRHGRRTRQTRPWALAGIFSGVGNEGIWRTEVPRRGPGAQPRWESWDEPPRSWQHFLKIMHKYIVYWDFRQHLQHKKQFTTFPGRGGGQVPPTSPCPCLRAPMHQAQTSSYIGLSS